MSEPGDIPEPSDAFWRETVRRGVMALGFKLARQGPTGELVAEIAALREGWTQTAALAAITVHKMIGAGADSGEQAAFHALARELRTSPAARESAIYRSLLIERTWREIREAPSERIEILANRPARPTE